MIFEILPLNRLGLIELTKEEVSAICQGKDFYQYYHNKAIRVIFSQNKFKEKEMGACLSLQFPLNYR